MKPKKKVWRQRKSKGFFRVSDEIKNKHMPRRKGTRIEGYKNR